MKSPQQDRPLELLASVPVLSDMVMGKKFWKAVRNRIESQRRVQIKNRSNRK